MAVIAYQYRGDLVDQIHRGHIAVTDHTGRILWKLGDPLPACLFHQVMSVL